MITAQKALEETARKYLDKYIADIYEIDKHIHRAIEKGSTGTKIDWDELKHTIDIPSEGIMAVYKYRGFNVSEYYNTSSASSAGFVLYISWG